MARINFEQDFLIDIRFLKLSEQIGRRQAIGEVVELWFLAQLYWKKGELIPLDVFKIHEFSEATTKFGIAEIKPEGVYVKGSDEQFSWLKQRVDAGRKGGLAKSNTYRKQTLAVAKPLPLPLPLPHTHTLKKKKKSNKQQKEEVVIEKKKRRQPEKPEWESIRAEVVDKAKARHGFSDEFCEVLWDKLLQWDQDKPYERRRYAATNWFSSEYSIQDWQRVKAKEDYKKGNQAAVEYIKSLGEGFYSEGS